MNASISHTRTRTHTQLNRITVRQNIHIHSPPKKTKIIMYHHNNKNVFGLFFLLRRRDLCRKPTTNKGGYRARLFHLCSRMGGEEKQLDNRGIPGPPCRQWQASTCCVCARSARVSIPGIHSPALWLKALDFAVSLMFNVIPVSVRPTTRQT